MSFRGESSVSIGSLAPVTHLSCRHHQRCNWSRRTHWRIAQWTDMVETYNRDEVRYKRILTGSFGHFNDKSNIYSIFMNYNLACGFSRPCEQLGALPCRHLLFLSPVVADEAKQAIVFTYFFFSFFFYAFFFSTHFGETPMAEIDFHLIFWHN